MSGRDNKARLPKMPGPRRPRASLVAAAAEQTAGADATAPVAPDATIQTVLGTVDTLLTTGAPSASGDEKMDVDPPSTSATVPPPPAAPAAPSTSEIPDAKPAVRPTATAGPSSALMVSSLSGSGPLGAVPSAAGGSVPSKPRFKPKMPIRRAAAIPEPEVKAEPSSSARGRGRGRGAARGAGRGGRGGARGGASLVTVAAGPFGGTRPAGAIRRVVPPPPPRNYMAEVTSAEVYSDNEDGTRAGVIDIEAVSGLGESAPTSVYRDRDLDGGKAKARAADKAKIKEAKARRRAARAAREALLSQGTGTAFSRVKDEPISPSLATMNLPGAERHGDSMIPADNVQDRDEEGRRVRALTTGTSMTRETTNMSETPDVDLANALHLSESEEEEYEEDMEGDFVFVPGLDNPEDKLFTFQFPTIFPKFVSRAPVDVDEEKKDDGAAAVGAEKKDEKDVKPTAAQLRRKKAALPPPEGRIGTLCVMKSGKVKLVLGEGDSGIVMNVNAGVPNTFLQQLVHVDQKKHATTVLGEVHKSYTVMPDVERLLDELFINGGETPGDRERAARIEERRAKMERGLVKMEPSSP